MEATLADSVIKRRLKSLRERRNEQAERARALAERQALVAQRAEAMGVSVGYLRCLERKGWAVPLVAHYGRDPDFEARRAAFYADMARVFSFDGWRFDKYQKELDVIVGFGGDGRDIVNIDQRSAVFLNATSAPFEWLIANGRLETKNDRPGFQYIRFSIGLRFRDEYEGSQLSPLKGVSMEETISGGGGGSAGAFNDYKIGCMEQIEKVRSMLPVRDFKMLVALLCDDQWIWKDAQGDHRKEILMRILRVLDRVGTVWGFITLTEYEERWRYT